MLHADCENPGGGSAHPGSRLPSPPHGRKDVGGVVGPAGHTAGLSLSGEDVDSCLAQAEEGRSLLAAAARYNALVVSAQDLDEKGRGELARAGYVVWTATAREEDAPSGGALVRGLDARGGNFVELACGSAGQSFLRGALNAMEEENCRIYQATAPALA